jgi:hypothetical protein
MIQRTTRIVLAASSILLAAACSAGGTGGPPISSVNPTSPSYGSMQFAVGTANLYNGTLGLNVVSTFRQTNGTSATGVNTPTITGPFTITAPPATGGGADPYSTILNGGPSLSETSGTPMITGTSQTVAPGTPNCDAVNAPAGFTSCQGNIAPNDTSFGQSGGVFAMGIAPYNHQASTGQSWSYQPYAQPIYGSGDTPFIPWGGPPAFDPDGTGLGERDGVGSINGVDSFGDPYFLGVGEGVTMFAGVTPRTGQYKLSIAIATIGNGGAVTTSTLSKTANLQSLTPLATITAPAVTPDANGDGGAAFTTSLPSGVTDAYVQIVDYGPGGGPNEAAPVKNPVNCQGARGTTFAPVYYTIHITNPASATYRLAPAIGPNLATSGGVSNIQPSPSLCTSAQNTSAIGSSTAADDFVVQMIGFDYPIYAAALGLTQSTTPENPTITNSAGQADVTISVPMEQDGGGPPVPSVKRVVLRHKPL